MRELRRLKVQNHLPCDFGGPESIVFHHGLKSSPERVREYVSGKDFIDAGACYGDSIWVFSQYSPRRIYGFEPSPRSLATCGKNLRRLGIPENRYRLVGSALGGEEGHLSFRKNGVRSNAIDGETAGSMEVRVETLDAFAGRHGLQVGVVKADVEGMGLELVRGAAETIRRFRPVLLLSIYHNEDEFWGIYPLLKSWDLNYHFEIRGLGRFEFQEINLIAWPAELTG